MMVTGITTSRLEELRKYKVSDIFEEKYYMDGTPINNGIVSGSIDSGVVVYYVNGIKYTDKYENNEVKTHFQHTPIEMDVEEGGNLLKISNYGKSVGLPQIKEDVFIDRDERSGFKDNYIISDMKNLVDIETFAGGNYFNIIKN